jgi:hypothetical protein
MNRQRKYVLLSFALVLAGCSQQSTVPSVLSPAPVAVQGSPASSLYRGISIADLMEVAEDVLSGMHFTIEKADARSGIVRTRPLAGAQFFEFWRSDNVGADNTIAANLHTIRRTVILNISPAPVAVQGSRQDEEPCTATGTGEIRIGCEVQAQRLSLPERQVSSSARVYGMFSLSSPSLQRLQINPEQAKEIAWIDLGRDSRLEAEILKRIEKQIVRRTNHRLQTTETKT